METVVIRGLDEVERGIVSQNLKTIIMALYKKALRVHKQHLFLLCRASEISTWEFLLILLLPLKITSI